MLMRAAQVDKSNEEDAYRIWPDYEPWYVKLKLEQIK